MKKLPRDNPLFREYESALCKLALAVNATRLEPYLEHNSVWGQDGCKSYLVQHAEADEWEAVSDLFDAYFAWQDDVGGIKEKQLNAPKKNEHTIDPRIQIHEIRPDQGASFHPYFKGKGEHQFPKHLTNYIEHYFSMLFTLNKELPDNVLFIQTFFGKWIELSSSDHEISPSDVAQIVKHKKGISGVLILKDSGMKNGREVNYTKFVQIKKDENFVIKHELAYRVSNYSFSIGYTKSGHQKKYEEWQTIFDYEGLKDAAKIEEVADDKEAKSATIDSQQLTEEDKPTPSVPIDKSITSEHIVCLECGAKLIRLLKHLKSKHNLERSEYCKRWGLLSDYPMTASAHNYEAYQKFLAEASEDIQEEDGINHKANGQTPPEPNKEDDEPVIIPPWMDKYKEWTEEELFDEIARLESKDRDTNEETELQVLNRELESRCQ